MVFILSFSIFFVCLAFILVTPCIISLWDSAAAHSPSGKELNLPLRKMSVFQGVAPGHTIFTSSCVIPLWDLATAHSPAGKELNSSSFNQSCFSGLIVVWCSHIILTGLSLFWCPPILILKPYMHLKQCFGLPQNGLRLRSLYCNDTWTSRYYSCKYCQF